MGKNKCSFPITREFFERHLFKLGSSAAGYFTSPVRWQSLPLPLTTSFWTEPILGNWNHSIYEQLTVGKDLKQKNMRWL